MADVFISYARVERDEAEAIRARLEALGLSVFLDVEGLDGGDVFSEVLDREVKTSGVVLGLWSPTALSRPWVQIECDIGKRRGVLVPVAIKPFTDMQTPAAFWNIQFVDLVDALDDPDHPGWRKLAKSLERTLKRPPGTLAPAPPKASALPPPSDATAPVGDSGAWLRTTPAKPSGPAPRTSTSGSGKIAGVAVAALLLLAAAGAGVWFADPFHWRTAQPAKTDATLAATSPTPATAATPPAANPAAEKIATDAPAPATPAALPNTSATAKVPDGPVEPEAQAPVPPASAPAPRPIQKPQDAAASGNPAPPRQVPGESLLDTAYINDTLLTSLATSRNGMALSPDGARIAVVHNTTNRDKNGRFVSEISLAASFAANGTQVFLAPLGNSDVQSVAYSFDGAHVLAGARDGAVHVLDATTGGAVKTLVAPRFYSSDPRDIYSIDSIAASRDGALIAAGVSVNRTTVPGYITVWDAKTGAVVKSWPAHLTDSAGIGQTNSLAFSPDSARLVSGGGDRTAKIWDARSGQLILTLSGHKLGVNAVAFSPDGATVATGSDDEHMMLWNATTGEMKVNFHVATSFVSGVAFSPDGKLLADVGRFGYLEVWDAKTGLALVRAKPKSASWLSTVAFGPDSRRIAVGGDKGASLLTVR